MLGTLYRYKLIRERASAMDAVLPPVQPQAAEALRRAIAEQRTALDEYEAKQIMAAFRGGCRGNVCRSEEREIAG